MSPVSHKVETVSIIVLKFNWSKFTHNKMSMLDGKALKAFSLFIWEH